MVFIGIGAGVASFLSTLQPPEQVSTPDLVDETLVDGLLALQQRELYPRIQLVFHADPTTRGVIVEQDPPPGTPIRIGRRVMLTVSQGPVVDRLEDYTGRQLSDVQLDLQVLRANPDQPPVHVGTVTRVFDDEPAGTILEHDPPPGAPITGLTEMAVVVSRGPDLPDVVVPAYIGVDYREAMAGLMENGIPFTVGVETTEEANRPAGFVVGQDPEPESTVKEGEAIHLVITPPEVDDDMRFGLFRRTLPEYAVPIALRLEVIEPDGSRKTIMEMAHPGGLLSIPYLVPNTSTLVLYRMDTEIVRQTIRAE